MRSLDPKYYLLTYTKGQRSKLIREHLLNKKQCSVFEWIFKDFCKNNEGEFLYKQISNVLSKKEALIIRNQIKIWVDFESFDYRIKRFNLINGSFLYSVQEFEKSTPWIFLEEYELTINSELLTNIFKETEFYLDYLRSEYSPQLNSNDKYIDIIQPFLVFKLKPTKYDYWINKRSVGQARIAGELGDDFLG